MTGFKQKILISVLATTLLIAGFFVQPQRASAKTSDVNGCVINNATFSPSGDQTASSGGPSITLTVRSSNCKNTIVGILLRNRLNVVSGYTNPGAEDFEAAFVGGAVGTAVVPPFGTIIGAVSASAGGIQNKLVWAGFREIEADTATITFSGSESENMCYKDLFGPDCLLSVIITSGGGLEYNSYDELGGSFYENSELKNSNLYLAYDCDGTCNSSSTVAPINETGFIKRTPTGEVVDPNDIQEVDTNSPCYDKSAGKMMEDCNALLAPLPGLTRIDSSVSLADYVNIIVRIAIGLVVVFAVVMLISYGFQYITQGSITGKADSKEKIRNALVGVLIALGMFVILSTINPNLLNLEPTIDAVSISAAAGSTSDSEFYNTGNTTETGAGCKALEDSLLGGERFASNSKRVQAIRTKGESANNYTTASGNFVFTKDKATVLSAMKQIITAGPFKGSDVLIESIYTKAKSHNIDPFLALAMWQSESSWGAKGAAATTHNIGNMRPGSSWTGQVYTSSVSGKFRDYNKTYGGSPESWNKSIEAYFELLKSRYISQGYDTVQEIIPMYAPCADKNNTLNYINNVVNRIKTGHAKI